MRYHKLYVSHCRISAYLMSNCVYKLLPSTYRCLCHCRAERMNDLPSMPYYFSNHWICKTFYMPLCICLSHMNMKDNNRKTTTNACHGESTARERERKKKEPATTIFTCNKIWIGIYLFNVHFVLSHSLTPNSLPCSYKQLDVCLCVCFVSLLGVGENCTWQHLEWIQFRTKFSAFQHLTSS